MATAFKSVALPFIHPDDMPERYAASGYGTCMEPLIMDGSLTVFDKSEPIEAGDIVGIVLTAAAAQRFGAPSIIKRLVMDLPPNCAFGAEPGGNAIPIVIVEQINPPRTLAIKASDILAVHKFIGTARAAGDGFARLQTSDGEA